MKREEWVSGRCNDAVNVKREERKKRKRISMIKYIEI
jgi:hypothetical protein